jgi:hypothetical protein
MKSIKYNNNQKTVISYHRMQYNTIKIINIINIILPSPIFYIYALLSFLFF